MPVAQSGDKRRKSQEHIWYFHNKLKGNVCWNPNFSESSKLSSSKRKKRNNSLWLPKTERHCSHTVRTWVCSQKKPAESPNVRACPRTTLESFRALPWHVLPSSLNLAANWDLFSQMPVNKQNHLQHNLDSQKIHRILYRKGFRDDLKGSISNSMYRNLRTWRSQSHSVSFNATDLFMSSLLSIVLRQLSNRCG